MAKPIAATVAATALFFLLTFAYARGPIVLLPAANNFVKTDLTESNPQATADILLPSEKPKTEPEQNQATAVESVELPKGKIGIDSATPITYVTFRPINRRPFMPFRRSHRCHGHHLHNFKPWDGQRFANNGQREVSFGKDMILSGSGGKYPGYQPLDGSHPVPLSWIKINHGGHRWSLIKDDPMVERIFDRPHHHHHHHHDDDESEDRDHHDHDHHDHHHGGIMKTIRKFLKHF